MKIYEKLFNIKQAGIKLIRDTEGYNYKYATLDQIQDKLGEILENQKLLVLHRIEDSKLITEIRDIESEEFISSEIEIAVQKAQDKGSEITYYRRYNLLALLDLQTDDDDGKVAQNSQVKVKSNTDDLPWIAQENIDKLTDLIADGKHFTLADIRKKYKVSKVNAEKLKAIGIS